MNRFPSACACWCRGRTAPANSCGRCSGDVFLYTAERIPEISDRIVEVDRAMRWGYGHTYGPFELWDALGFEAVCDRIEAEGRTLPDNIVQMRSKGAASFYRAGDHDGLPQKEYFDLRNLHYDLLEQRPGVYCSGRPETGARHSEGESRGFPD